MATQDESTERGVGVGPQTPAARQRAQEAPTGDTGVEPDQETEPAADPDPGAELTAIEESASPTAARVSTGEPGEASPKAPTEPASAEEPTQQAEDPAVAPPFADEPAEPTSAEERAQRSFASAMERARRASVPPLEWPPPLSPSSTRRRAGFTSASTGGRLGFGPATSSEHVRFLPASTRERLVALLALGSAVGVLLFVLASLGSSGSPAPGLAGFEVTSSSRVVAPGGWISLSGSGAPEGTRLLLETRSEGGPWRSAGSASSDEQGDFRVRGRALASPGALEVRARVPGAGASRPTAMTVRPLRLAAVGDINLGDAPGAAIAANGPRYPWTSVRTPLRNADLAFGNLECAVSNRGEPFPKQFNFRGTPAALRGLRRYSGIDVLNLANNHVGDYGSQALLDTVRHVEKLEIRAVGAGRNLRRALAPQVVERLGLRVAFVGFSQIAPIEFAAGDRTPGTAWATPEAVADGVRAARRRADVVVATFHWGIEKAPFETADQQMLAQTAAAAGAHLVIGAHPHVLQPMRREGAAVVAYSLGNFVFGAASSDTTSTGILEADLSADGVSAARWRRGRIVAGRPVLDRRPPRRLPVRDPDAMGAGVSL